MDIKTFHPNRRIVLFGQQNLQNSLLVGAIHQRTHIHCQLSVQPLWRHEWNEQFANMSVLVLVDAECARLEKLQALLDSLYHQPVTCKIAFFNVSDQHTVAQFMSWPEVNGLFPRSMSQNQMCKGIQALFAGEFWLPRQLLAEYLNQHRHRPKPVAFEIKTLTKRERQILYFTSQGASNQDIATALELSTHTVKTHIYNVFKKIGVSNRIQAFNWAREHATALGLVSSEISR